MIRNTSTNNLYRPPSYSESYIYDIKNTKDIKNKEIKNKEINKPELKPLEENKFDECKLEDNNQNTPNKDLSEPFIEFTNQEPKISVLEIEPIHIPKNYPSKCTLYIFKRLIMFLMHLSLIGLFEIIFFFTIVSVEENNAILKIINNFTNNIPNLCSNLNFTQKLEITYIFNEIFNVSSINNNANFALQQRQSYNNNLFIYSWLYFVGIIIINAVLLIFNYKLKLRIKIKKILLDNLIMIIILGLYEYLFFKTIIMNYEAISTHEKSKKIKEKD
jgi:hypothetical protein